MQLFSENKLPEKHGQFLREKEMKERQNTVILDRKRP